MSSAIEGQVQARACAAAHAEAGGAWFALYDSTRALATFDDAGAILGADGLGSAADMALRSHVQCGRGKCLVDLQRPSEAIPELDAAIGWYTTQCEPANEAQQSLLAQALHTLRMAIADAGAHEKALEATARAVELRRRLADDDRMRNRPALSESLRVLGNWLYELGRHEEALQVRREVLALQKGHRDDPLREAVASRVHKAVAPDRFELTHAGRVYRAYVMPFSACRRPGPPSGVGTEHPIDADFPAYPTLRLGRCCGPA